ncbi:hypothetical protein DN604_00640 [Aeromonas caviae]|nr:hypothetical protein DN604_00640 [Aeromonas caviae]
MLCRALLIVGNLLIGQTVLRKTFVHGRSFDIIELRPQLGVKDMQVLFEVVTTERVASDAFNFRAPHLLQDGVGFMSRDPTAVTITHVSVTIFNHERYGRDHAWVFNPLLSQRLDVVDVFLRVVITGIEPRFFFQLVEGNNEKVVFLDALQSAELSQRSNMSGSLHFNFLSFGYHLTCLFCCCSVIVCRYAYPS